MRAMRIERYGGPEVASIVDAPMPVAGPGMVLVRVAASGINFMDIGTRQGRYESSRTYQVSLPCTLGMEGAGEVVEVGAGVTRVRPGDRVAWCLSWGSYAEFAAVPENLVARLPDGIAFQQAAAAMFQGATAHYLVHDVARLKDGDTCLVHAASGSIGQIITQMGRNRGARVFATASTEQKRAVVASRGADAVWGYEDFDQRVRDATDGVGVDVVFDSVGLTTLRSSMRCTRRRGLVINYGSVSGPVTDLDPLELGESGSLFLTRPRLGDHMTTADEVQMRADAIFGGILNGWLRIDIAGTYALESVHEALDALESRRMIGKPVLLL
ncbi:quinone oxidoreductase family protein [Variovorax sp. RA8]|uniref:quinone oxidoreductase family protein n=1 Tax=Variovorax sp. (strain JCM 16519 / RA8) TaxID=662548 RepID=UPI001317CAA0|nr:quinone oxidoreductase [Variovorax sp. RA8]VTU16093.1 Quinone oxidoreductase 1 [Variovorax sp. RA8]